MTRGRALEYLYEIRRDKLRIAVMARKNESVGVSPKVVKKQLEQVDALDTAIRLIREGMGKK